MKNLLYIFVLLIGSFGLSAQNIEVNAEIDTNYILIGQQTQINLSIVYRVDDGEVAIQFPQLQDTINELIEIISQSNVDTIIPNKDDKNLFEQSRQIIITSFDSGYYEIPAFHFIVNSDTLSTLPLFLEVQNMEVDTSETIFDIKAPLAEPFSITDWLKEHWMWVAGTLALVLLIILLIVYLSKKKPIEIIKEVEPTIPPHVIALERLETLNNNKLWQDGKVKTYHSAISEIIREYIEHRYQTHALEETTTEIIHSLRLHGIDSLIMTKLNQTLVLADLVKFAKEKPLASEHEMSMNNAIEFINSTKLVEPTITKNAE